MKNEKGKTGEINLLWVIGGGLFGVAVLGGLIFLLSSSSGEIDGDVVSDTIPGLVNEANSITETLNYDGSRLVSFNDEVILNKHFEYIQKSLNTHLSDTPPQNTSWWYLCLPHMDASGDQPSQYLYRGGAILNQTYWKVDTRSLVGWFGRGGEQTMSAWGGDTTQVYPKTGAQIYKSPNSGSKVCLVRMSQPEMLLFLRDFVDR